MHDSSCREKKRKAESKAPREGHAIQRFNEHCAQCGAIRLAAWQLIAGYDQRAA